MRITAIPLVRSSRYERAQQQNMSYVIEAPNLYKVTGTQNTVYDVCINVDDFSQSSCTCQDHFRTRCECKHIFLILIKEYNYVFSEENTSKIVYRKNEESIETCSICLEEVKIGDSMWECSKCKNCLHETCIRRWIHKNTCPLCREIMCPYEQIHSPGRRNYLIDSRYIRREGHYLIAERDLAERDNLRLSDLRRLLRETQM